MDVDKLKLLADTVEHGVVEFPQYDKVVAFDMGYEYHNVERLRDVPLRSDIKEPLKVTACACGIGFAMMLFSPLAALLKDTAAVDDIDLFTEARLILQLPDQEASLLFYGRMSSHITGAQFARVVRNLLLTGTVDWMIITV